MTSSCRLLPTSRRYRSRRVAVALIVLCLHGLVLYALLSALTVAPSSAPQRSVLVTIINQAFPRWGRKLPVPKVRSLRSVSVALDTSDLQIRFAPALVSPKVPTAQSDLQIGLPPSLVPPRVPAAQSGGRNGSGLMPGTRGRGSQGQDQQRTEGNGSGARRVLHSVSPQYSQYAAVATIRVRLFVDRKGEVRDVTVDPNTATEGEVEETVHAVKQWVFEPSARSEWIPLTFVIGNLFYPAFTGRLSLAILDTARTQLLLDSAIPATSASAKSLAMTGSSQVDQQHLGHCGEVFRGSVSVGFLGKDSLPSISEQ